MAIGTKAKLISHSVENILLFLSHRAGKPNSFVKTRKYFLQSSSHKSIIRDIKLQNWFL